MYKDFVLKFILLYEYDIIYFTCIFDPFQGRGEIIGKYLIFSLKAMSIISIILFT